MYAVYTIDYIIYQYTKACLGIIMVYKSMTDRRGLQVLDWHWGSSSVGLGLTSLELLSALELSLRTAWVLDTCAVCNHASKVSAGVSKDLGHKVFSHSPLLQYQLEDKVLVEFRCCQIRSVLCRCGGGCHGGALDHVYVYVYSIYIYI